MNLHEVNKNSVNHLLPKVTERCMKPCAQNVMKIGLAAQVMRSTVATQLSALWSQYIRATALLHLNHVSFISSGMWCNCL